MILIHRTTLALLLPAAFAASACSDAVPPASEGATTLQFTNTPTGGQQCNIQTHLAQIGYADAVEFREPIRDTVEGAQISCAVAENGGSFAAAGYMSHRGVRVQFDIPSITTSASESSPAKGSIRLATPTTVSEYSSPGDVPCEFWFSGDQEVAPGRVWVQFRCAQVAFASQGRSCALSTSTIAMQNCEQ